MDEEEKKYYLAFSVFQGIGPLRFKLLLDYFGSAKEAYFASSSCLEKIGLSEKIVSSFVVFRKTFNPDSYFIRLLKEKIVAFCSEEKNYPKILKEIKDKPIVIYVKSLLSITELAELLSRPAIAVVGARKITGYGRQATEMITRRLAEAGLTIVSGLALGVDRVAHESALLIKGKTVAVLGHGLDMVYPSQNKDLAERIILEGSVLLSEFPLGLKPFRGSFPARNRIISGLSLGVVITEAAEDSGSLITASYAADQGREVFAVPGPITSPLSAGTAGLIQKGAKLVYRAEDILEELGIKTSNMVKASSASNEMKIDLSEDEKKILTALEFENLHINELSRKTGMEIKKIGGLLSILEIKSIIKCLGEGVYGREN